MIGLYVHDKSVFRKTQMGVYYRKDLFGKLNPKFNTYVKNDGSIQFTCSICNASSELIHINQSGTKIKHKCKAMDRFPTYFIFMHEGETFVSDIGFHLAPVRILR